MVGKGMVFQAMHPPTNCLFLLLISPARMIHWKYPSNALEKFSFIRNFRNVSRRSTRVLSLLNSLQFGKFVSLCADRVRTSFLRSLVFWHSRQFVVQQQRQIAVVFIRQNSSGQKLRVGPIRLFRVSFLFSQFQKKGSKGPSGTESGVHVFFKGPSGLHGLVLRGCSQTTFTRGGGQVVQKC